jgi:uncharacterized membrane protein
LDEDTKVPHPRPRIESLSDLVFGLGLSLGAFALVSNPPTPGPAFYRDIITFGFNFVVLITIWVRYTRIMSALPIETRTTLLLNCILLFTVILEPFIFNILRLNNTANPPTVNLFETASSSYGLDLGAAMLIMGVFTLALADEEKRLVPASLVRQLRLEALVWFVSSALFFVSAVPLFGRVDAGGHLVTGLSLRIVLWLGAIVIAWVTWGIDRPDARKTDR